jgi:hypothetical protein
MQTINRERGEIEDILRDSPSLRRDMAALIDQKAPRAIQIALAALADRGETPTNPIRPDYTPEQVLDDWWPEPTPTTHPTKTKRKRPT